MAIFNEDSLFMSNCDANHTRGKVYTQKEIGIICEFLDISIDGFVNYMLDHGHIYIIENPKVIDYIKYEKYAMAIFKHHNQHGCGIADSKKIVDRMIKDMNKKKE